VVTVAVRLGGDTDTIAAMAGAMAGAAWGLTGVAAPLLERLEAREELERLATALAAT
jgi:ADP-ribosylglycohydrolase